MKTIAAHLAGILLAVLPAATGRAQLPLLSPECFGSSATIVGTEGDDVLTGTPEADVIAGLEGDDVIRGLAGDDALCGGQGTDEVTGETGSDAIAVGRGADTANGGEGFDIVIEFSSDHCSPCLPVDPRSRDEDVDHLSGGPGPDWMSAEGGNDVVDGGSGEDFALNLSRFTSVNVDLTAGTAVSSAGGVDELRGIESVLGSVNGDYIRGDERGNGLFGVGFAGHDVILGEDGPDRIASDFSGATLVGGFDESPDTVYVVMQEPALVDLAAGTASSRENSHVHVPDVIAGFENAVGTIYDDMILGDENANLLEGGYGHDEVAGAGGNDYLFGDDLEGSVNVWGGSTPGNDVLDGGAGRDRLNGGPLVDQCRNGEAYVSCERRDGAETPSYLPARGPRGLPWWWARLDIEYLTTPSITSSLLTVLR